jgi:hypothetical protein
MRLKISDLQQVVEQTLQEKRAVDDFCNEIKKAFGPTVVVSEALESLVEQAHYRLDVLERTGRLGYVQFNNRAALRVANHKNPEVRRLAARLLPESSSVSFIYDKNASVRSTAACSAPLKMVEAAMKKYPSDENLRDIFERRALNERADSALKAAAAGPPGEELLSDGWYEKTAHKLIQDYGRTLDTGWVPSAVNQLCSAARASNRFNIDAYKLMKKVTEVLADSEEKRLERFELKESAEYFSTSNEEFESDNVAELVEAKLSAKEYIEKANKLFSIKSAIAPASLRKFAVNENRFNQILIPTVGVLPSSRFLRHVDELALDTYVKHWNTVQSLHGNSYKLSWSPHPDSQNKFSFNLVLK